MASISSQDRTNPFYHRGPVRDAARFYGRDTETRQALALLKNGQSVSIVGPRRIGKTSLLIHLADPGAMLQSGLRPGTCCFVYINCESWIDQPAEVLYGVLLEQLAAALAGEGLEGLLVEPPPGLSAPRLLQSAVQAVAGKGIQVVFVLDEFEALGANTNLGPGFFSGLRGLANSYSAAFVTASREPLRALAYANASTLSSPFFNFFAQIRLYPFPLPTARESLVKTAAAADCSFSEAAVDFLLSLAGPHPLLLQIAGYHGFEQGGCSSHALDGAWRSAVRAGFLSEAEDHWAYMWQGLSERERRLLALLPEIYRSDVAGVRRLEQQGLVLVRDGRPEPLSRAFAEFVARRPVAGLYQAPPVTLDPAERIALVHGQCLSLSRTEFDLLACLVSHAGEVLPRERLEACVWPGEANTFQDAERLKAGLKALRRALGENASLIENVRGVGYRFVEEPGKGDS